MVTGVVAARALGVSGRGDFALLSVAPVSLVVLGGLGLPQATAYFTAQARNTSDRLEIIRTATQTAVPVSVVLTVVYLVAAFVLSAGVSDVKVPALISSGLVFLVYIQSLGIGILQGMQEFDRYNVFRVMPLAIYAPLSAVMFALGLATLSSLIAMFTASFAIAAALTWKAVNRLNNGSEHPKARFPRKALVSFGLRSVLGDGHPADQVRLDQLIVGLLVGARGLGLYSSGASFSNLSRFVAKSIGAVAFPRIASAGQGSERRRLSRRALLIGGSGVLLITGVLEALLPFLVEFFFGEAFKGAVPIGRVLLVAGALLALKRLLTDIARGLGHPGYGSVAEVINVLTFGAGLAVLALMGSLTAQGVAWAVALGGLASLVFFAVSFARLESRRPG